MLLEIIVTVAVIIGILMFVGVPVTSILGLLLLVLSGLLVLTVGAFVLFFVITDIMLLFYRRVDAAFLRIDDSTRFEHAVYSVDGDEYACTFPAESIARRQIYEKPKHRILIPRRGKRKIAYDLHSLFIIRVGTVAAMLLTAGMVFAVYRLHIF